MTRYMITDTLAGPVVHCNFECDYDEAEGGLLNQCRACAKVQDELDKPFVTPSRTPRQESEAGSDTFRDPTGNPQGAASRLKGAHRG